MGTVKKGFNDVPRIVYLLGCIVGDHNFQQGHDVSRAEEMRSYHSVSCLCLGTDQGNINCRSVCGQDCVRPTGSFKVSENLLLDLDILYCSLNHLQMQNKSSEN